MHEKQPRSRIKRRAWILLATLSVVLVSAVWSALSLNRTLPTIVLAGTWTVTDLRGPPDGNATPYEISVAPDGTFDNHDGFMIRFRLKNGLINVHSWPKVPNSVPSNSFFAKVQDLLSAPFESHRNDFDLIAAISDDQNEIRLAFPGEAPFKTLTRVGTH